MQKLETSNPIICSFYQSNPSFNFESMNLLLVEMLKNVVKNTQDNKNEQVLTNMHDFFNNFNNQITNLNSKVDTQFKSFSTQLESIKSINNLTLSNNEKDINTIKELLSQINTSNNKLSYDVSNELVVKFNEFKNNYIDSLKSFVENILNDKSKFNNSAIEEQFQRYNGDLYNNVEKLIQNTLPQNDTSLKDFFDNKCSTLITNAQQPIITLLSSSNETIKSLHQINTNVFQQFEKQLNSTIKGAVSENKLHSILSDLFPSSEITKSANEKKSGDFIVRADETIMFENKDYERNVPPEEVKKFMRDIEEVNSHGIFLSQSSGITLKPNYHIDIHNSNVLVYVHYVNYDKEKIKCAIQIIHTLAPRLRSIIQNNGNNNISSEILEDINREFNIFIEKKEMLLTISKDHLKKISNSIQEIQFPNLEKYLGTKFAPVASQNFKCDICNLFIGKSFKSLAKHKQSCIKKKDITICVET